MDPLYTFWDNITHYRVESVHFLGLMNSATKKGLGGAYGPSGFCTAPIMELLLLRAVYIYVLAVILLLLSGGGGQYPTHNLSVNYVV